MLHVNSHFTQQRKVPSEKPPALVIDPIAVSANRNWRIDFIRARAYEKGGMREGRRDRRFIPYYARGVTGQGAGRGGAGNTKRSCKHQPDNPESNGHSRLACRARECSWHFYRSCRPEGRVASFLRIRVQSWRWDATVGRRSRARSVLPKPRANITVENTRS